MSVFGIAFLVIFFGAAAVLRIPSAPWMLRVLAGSVVIAVIVYAAWFAMLFTGVVRLDWLARWLGTPKFQRPWDLIVLFGPAVVAAVVYLIFAVSRRGKVLL
jgi:hypothetical protein